MIVSCAHNRSSGLSDHQRGRFASIDATYDLTVGKNYVALGLGIWETVLQVLIQDDNGLPNWCPMGLFDCKPQAIPAHWKFGLRSGITASGSHLWTQWVAIWGYEELVDDPGHSDALMERSRRAHTTFHKELRRREAEASGDGDGA